MRCAEPHSATLSRLIAEPDLRGRLAITALAECRRVYSGDAVGRQIIGIYADLQGRPQPAFDTVLPLAPCRFRLEPHLL